jgi:hypothetical protein
MQQILFILTTRPRFEGERKRETDISTARVKVANDSDN